MNESLIDAELRRDEGVRYSPYRDTKGILTVGIGHNMEASPLPSDWIAPLTDDQVDQLLNHDLSVVYVALDLHLPWWEELDEVRQRVVVNMAFNLGTAKLCEFHQTLACMKAADYAGAADGMLDSAWANEVHDRATRLADAMRTGVMPA